MELVRVVGTVVAESKHESLAGVRLLVLQPTEGDGTTSGEPFGAADPFQAGPGDTVAGLQGARRPSHCP